ncbi:hypothetical protein Nepgr_031842 [Nepenthes gracilis]|uniref:Myb-like domain-containing protein n=1 Tax=Nepenthes gracilis TaxID=150966 RepID=A0AAD3Y7F3_NEPGR|nr:hypothetical protein Nepgr_031842 [Nepenthes gracilis]
MEVDREKDEAFEPSVNSAFERNSTEEGSSPEDGLIRVKRFSREEDEMVRIAVVNYIEVHSLGDEGKWADADDYHLLIALFKLDASCEEDVDWDGLLEHRSGNVCRKRWSQMVLHIGEVSQSGYENTTDSDPLDVVSCSGDQAGLEPGLGLHLTVASPMSDSENTVNSVDANNSSYAYSSRRKGHSAMPMAPALNADGGGCSAPSIKSPHVQDLAEACRDPEQSPCCQSSMPDDLIDKIPDVAPSVETCIRLGMVMNTAGAEGAVLGVFDSVSSFAILQDQEVLDAQVLQCGPPDSLASISIVKIESAPDSRLEVGQPSCSSVDSGSLAIEQPSCDHLTLPSPHVDHNISGLRDDELVGGHYPLLMMLVKMGTLIVILMISLLSIGVLSCLESRATPIFMSAIRMIDIAVNFTDGMFRGIYNGKQHHAADIQSVLSRAWSAGVNRIIVTGGSLEESKEALAISETDGRLFCTVGVHPTRCKEFEESGDPDRHFQSLLLLAKEGVEKGKVVAVGECGLDYDRLHFCPADIQKMYFGKQFELAYALKLPMFLHMRAAAEDFCNILECSKSRFTAGVCHSFTGSAEDRDKLLSFSNMYIGVNGCSLKTLENLEVLKGIPVERIMIETDSPYCEIKNTHAGIKMVKSTWPSKKKEKYDSECLVKGRNEPCLVRQVLEVVAGCKGIVDMDQLSKILYHNTCSVFFPHDLDAAADALHTGNETMTLSLRTMSMRVILQHS